MTAESQPGSGAAVEFQSLVDEFVSGAGATDSKMFGAPTLKIGAKVFACLWKDNVVFKLPVGERQRALAMSGAHLFDPGNMGRAMKEWVVVPVEHAREWSELGWAALHYVAVIAAEGASDSGNVRRRREPRTSKG